MPDDMALGAGGFCSQLVRSSQIFQQKRQKRLLAFAVNILRYADSAFEDQPFSRQ